MTLYIKRVFKEDLNSPLNKTDWVVWRDYFLCVYAKRLAKLAQYRRRRDFRNFFLAFLHEKAQ